MNKRKARLKPTILWPEFYIDILNSLPLSGLVCHLFIEISFARGIMMNPFVVKLGSFIQSVLQNSLVIGFNTQEAVISGALYGTSG